MKPLKRVSPELIWTSLLIVTFASSVSSLCAAQSMFRGNAAHTGVYDAHGPRELKGIKWKFATGGRVLSSPVADQNVIYFGSYDRNVYAFDAETGVQKWKYSTFGPIASTPAVANGIVYVMSYDGKFYAIDAATGKSTWKFNTAGDRHFEAKGLHGAQPMSQTYVDAWDMFQSSQVVAQDMVFFGSGDGNLYALDAATGVLRWKFATATWFTLRRHTMRESSILAVGIVISMPSTPPPARRNGNSRPETMHSFITRSAFKARRLWSMGSFMLGAATQAFTPLTRRPDRRSGNLTASRAGSSFLPPW